MKYDCLVVDDELEIAQSASEYLSLFGVTSACVYNIADCLAFLQQNEVALLLLDVNLGTESGFSLCRVLRESSNIPILFLSARTSDDDVLTALNIGGDDYLKKPFSLSILLAKVKAMLKRCRGTEPSAILRIGEIEVDRDSHRVTAAGKPAKLQEMEYRLFLYLACNRNRVVSKDELFQNVWGESIVGDGTLSVHIRHLREKLEQDPDHPTLIKTVWGAGYLLEDR